MAEEQRDSSQRWRTVVAQPIEAHCFRPLSAATHIEVAAATVCGEQRQQNTDHYLAIRLGRMQETMITSLAMADLPPRFEEYGYALLVADGLGDGGSGARASRVALSAIADLAIRYGKWNVRVDPESTLTMLEQGQFLWARTHDAVVRASRSDERLADMATSVTALYIAGADLFFAHVGHSKAFLFRDGTLMRLTADLADDVTHAVGGRSDPQVDVEHIRLSNADRLLLCTNGLTESVDEHNIARVLALQRRPADDCDRLLELAAAARAPDDVTVMVADYRLQM